MDQIYLKFSIKELSCRCGCGLGQSEMHPDFMSKLSQLRFEANIPLQITSAVRCANHNIKVSSSGMTGPHTLVDLKDGHGKRCHAVDIKIHGKELAHIIDLIGRYKIQFTGLGLKQKGDYSGRFLHIDDLPYSANRQRPWIWTY